MDINNDKALEQFLTKTETRLKIGLRFGATRK